MGLKDKLFGSRNKHADKAANESVCAECGMSDGDHTSWCPSTHSTVDAEQAWTESMSSSVEEDGTPPVSNPANKEA